MTAKGIDSILNHRELHVWVKGLLVLLVHTPRTCPSDSSLPQVSFGGEYPLHLKGHGPKRETAASLQYTDLLLKH